MNMTLDMCRSTVPVTKILMRDVFRPAITAGHHAWKNKYSRNMNYARERSKNHARKRELVFDKTFVKYLDEIESITGIEISPRQRNLLKQDIDNNTYVRLSPDESQQWRKEFNSVRGQLIAEWEENCGMKWPTYPENKIYKGKIIRKKGSKHDAHEVILNSWGSPHQWYNLTPCPTPEHQNKIHGHGSMAEQIFG